MQPAPADTSTDIVIHRIKSIVGGSLGNLVEWYDWYIYSFFSLYFAGVFFPKGNQTAQLLNTAGIFAIGFLMRPIGGWLMGTYADRKGRKTALMGLAHTLCIRFVPGYYGDVPEAQFAGTCIVPKRKIKS
jgi:MHS family alpha-ketoglutarate permease-like MFS transporter